MQTGVTTNSASRQYGKMCLNAGRGVMRWCNKELTCCLPVRFILGLSAFDSGEGGQQATALLSLGSSPGRGAVTHVTKGRFGPLTSAANLTALGFFAKYHTDGTVFTCHSFTVFSHIELVVCSMFKWSHVTLICMFVLISTKCNI